MKQFWNLESAFSLYCFCQFLPGLLFGRRGDHPWFQNCQHHLHSIVVIFIIIAIKSADRTVKWSHLCGRVWDWSRALSAPPCTLTDSISILTRGREPITSGGYFYFNIYTIYVKWAFNIWCTKYTIFAIIRIWIKLPSHKATLAQNYNSLMPSLT